MWLCVMGTPYLPRPPHLSVHQHDHSTKLLVNNRSLHVVKLLKFVSLHVHCLCDQIFVQVREIRIPWQEATGPCKARYLAQQLWDGEEFCLQIDSHTRFVPGWDTKLKQMLQQGEQMSAFGKAVVSSYPPAYDVRL